MNFRLKSKFKPTGDQPEAIENLTKRLENDEKDKLRLAATTNILTRPDTIVVASVSAIYNLGSPDEYGKIVLHLMEGVKVTRLSILDRLLDLMYARNDYDFKRSAFRVRGDTIEVIPGYEDNGIRITLAGEF